MQIKRDQNNPIKIRHTQNNNKTNCVVVVVVKTFIFSD